MTMDYGWESNDRTERKSCGDPRELAAERRWELEQQRRAARDNEWLDAMTDES